MKHAVPLAALSLLAACAKPAGDAAKSTGNTASPVDATTPAPAGVPARLQGRWGLTPQACDPARAGPGLLTIGADALAINAAAEQVDRVIIRPDRVAIDTSVTEGDTEESRRYELLLSPDGKTLTRAEDPRRPLVYTRCPNNPS